MVYKDSESCIINNGTYSDFFNLQRGCRQGDPWSAYLFILAIEPLSQYIKNNESIRGLVIGREEIKIGQYADDTFLVLDGTELSIHTTINTLKHFEEISGLKINVEKTVVIKLGIENIVPGQKCLSLNIPYSTTFKLLGINFSTDLSEVTILNYGPKIAVLQNLVRLYQGRNLSMIGRITVVKMFMLPKLIHLFRALPTPEQNIFEEIKRIMTSFIWNNKRPKISHNTLVQEYKYGGQKMIDLATFNMSMKLDWVKKIYKASSRNSWKVLAMDLLKEKCLK